MLGSCILRHYGFRRRDNSFKAIKVIKFSWRMLLFDQAPEEENTFMTPMLKLERAEKRGLNHCESFMLHKMLFLDT